MPWWQTCWPRASLSRTSRVEMIKSMGSPHVHPVAVLGSRSNNHAPITAFVHRCIAFSSAAPGAAPTIRLWLRPTRSIPWSLWCLGPYYCIAPETHSLCSRISEVRSCTGDTLSLERGCDDAGPLYLSHSSHCWIVVHKWCGLYHLAVNRACCVLCCPAKNSVPSGGRASEGGSVLPRPPWVIQVDSRNTNSDTRHKNARHRAERSTRHCRDGG